MQGRNRARPTRRRHKLSRCFGQFDANGDGQISKSEFENVFGANADTSKVDGLFNALDTNGDGSVSRTSSRRRRSRARPPHHHMHGGGGSEQTGGLADLLSATSATARPARRDQCRRIDDHDHQLCRRLEDIDDRPLGAGKRLIAATARIARAAAAAAM